MSASGRNWLDLPMVGLPAVERMTLAEIRHELHSYKPLRENDIHDGAEWIERRRSLWVRLDRLTELLRCANDSSLVLGAYAADDRPEPDTRRLERGLGNLFDELT